VQLKDLSTQQVIEFHDKLGYEVGFAFVCFKDNSYVDEWFRRITISYQGIIPEDILRNRPFVAWRAAILPYTPGTIEVPPEKQIKTAIHEAVHVNRIKKYRGTVFDWYKMYFESDHDRALEEGSANECVKIDVQYALTGTFGKLNLSTGYCLSPEAIESAERSFEMRKRVIKRMGRGTTLDLVSSVSLQILDEMGVAIR
jgi:hypothetical protein